VGFLSLLNRLISHEAGSLGVSVGFNTQALPVFSQWKNEAGKRDSGWTGDGGAAEPLVDLTKGGAPARALSADIAAPRPNVRV
jgi:hypothetical protein